MTKYSDFQLNNRKLLSLDYDPLFKAIVTGDWSIESDGDVESTTGAFALVEIPHHAGELAEMQDAFNDPDTDYTWPDPGWFVTTEDSNGQIWVYEFASEREATVAYRKLIDEYTEWVISLDEASGIPAGDTKVE